MYKTHAQTVTHIHVPSLLAVVRLMSITSKFLVMRNLKMNHEWMLKVDSAK